MTAFDSFHHATLGQLLTRQAAQHPDQIFITLNDRRWTYAEAEQQATALASALLNLSLQPGDRLAAILPNLPECVLTIFAAAKAGLILTPINIRRHRVEVQARLRKTQATAVITTADHLSLLHELQIELPALRHLIAIDGDGDAMVLNGERERGARAGPHVAGRRRGAGLFREAWRVNDDAVGKSGGVDEEQGQGGDE